MFDGLSVASSGERVNNRKKNESRNVLLTLCIAGFAATNLACLAFTHCLQSKDRAQAAVPWILPQPLPDESCQGCGMWQRTVLTEGMRGEKESFIFNNKELSRVKKGGLFYNYFIQMLLGLHYVDNVFSILWGGEQRSTDPFTKTCLWAQLMVKSPLEAPLLQKGSS